MEEQSELNDITNKETQKKNKINKNKKHVTKAKTNNKNKIEI